jgi:hypothetical protein
VKTIASRFTTTGELCLHHIQMANADPGAPRRTAFEAYGTAGSVTKAGFLAEKGRETEVFVRFSTVLPRPPTTSCGT